MISMEKKNINYFYKHGLSKDCSSKSTFCIYMPGRNNKKRKIEHFDFKCEKTNKM
jgi:hypothetical protein